jgi:hypothetical protein
LIHDFFPTLGVNDFNKFLISAERLDTAGAMSAAARGIAWFGIAAVACIVMLACERKPAPGILRPAAAAPIDLKVDFNGRRDNKQFPVDWRAGMTAFSLLELLAAEGQLHVSHRGHGNQTLVTAIDGLENQWGAGDNWIFTVNGRLGDRSSAVFELRPGDRVVWRFGKYAPD